ncbi:hypothetical protein OSTOST_18589 [Ostertagia ostertagi]
MDPWSDEEIYDWLRRFSLSLEQAAQTGVDTTKEEIVKLLTSLAAFNIAIQQGGICRRLHRTLRLAQDLLDAALSQHMKNAQNLSNSLSTAKSEEVSEMMTNDRSPSDFSPTSENSDRR